MGLVRRPVPGSPKGVLFPDLVASVLLLDRDLACAPPTDCLARAGVADRAADLLVLDLVPVTAGSARVFVPGRSGRPTAAGSAGD